jgi:hypothetical protein
VVYVTDENGSIAFDVELGDYEVMFSYPGYMDFKKIFRIAV